jgi:hypothetical protein
MKSICFSFALLLFTAAGLAQSQRLQDINVNFMLRGYFFAGSRIADNNALGGFGSSDNLPKPIDSSVSIPDGDISVIAYPDQVVAFGSKYRGVRVILANTTDEKVALSASDSRLYMVQEAIDIDGKWKPVEYLPSSWCGNSYHTVFLPSHEYWEFAAAHYTGKRPTKFRIKLSITDPADQKTTTILSNEFEGSVNPKQFTVQQGHEPKSIMDPYNN